MDYDREINALAAETLALQAVLTGVHLSRADPVLLSRIKLGFDDAANQVECMAIKVDAADAPHHMARALQIVEFYRTLTLGNLDETERGV
jgi:hypothetical protein